MALFDVKPDGQLDSNQQRLLRTALASNQPSSGSSTMSPFQAKPFGAPAFQNAPTFDNFDLDPVAFPDYLDGDSSFAIDNTELSGIDPEELEIKDIHDKRKASDADHEEEDDEADAKRHEGDEKQAKKPGRKPLTSEPTTKRKAQNRAAQRAFRERKEKHLKDLETKVTELTKSSEEDKQENGILRAQVARLQTELKEYRKRLSIDASKNRSPPTVAANTHNEFAFDFPAFGMLPTGGQGFGSNNTIKRENGDSPSAISQIPRHNSETIRPSPRNKTSTGASPITAGNQLHRGSSANSSSLQSFAGLFSPSLLNGVAAESSPDYGFPRASQSPIAHDNGTNTNSGINRVFRFNSESGASNTDSPSQSSLSQYNVTSSCDTSPAPSHPSPPKDTPSSNTGSSLMNPSNTSSIPTPVNGIDWLASQNGGGFDPVLFGDYRESQDAIVGDGEFSNGFFNDAFPYDFASPLNFDAKSPEPTQTSSNMLTTPTTTNTTTLTPATVKAAAAQKSAQCASLLAKVDETSNGLSDDFGLADQTGTIAPSATLGTDNKNPMLSANTIWAQLQQNKDFQDGKFDLDGLCSELRTKATCAEYGVAIPEDRVKQAFDKLSGKKKDSTASRDDTEGPDYSAGYVFQGNEVDDALVRLGASKGSWGAFGL